MPPYLRGTLWWATRPSSEPQYAHLAPPVTIADRVDHDSGP